MSYLHAIALLAVLFVPFTAFFGFTYWLERRIPARYSDADGSYEVTANGVVIAKKHGYPVPLSLIRQSHRTLWNAS